jgi:hypothetical protein
MNIKNVKEETVNSVNLIVAQNSNSKSNKKSRRWDHPVRDKLEDVFCIKKSTFVRPGIIYAEADKTKNISKVIEAQKFHMNGKKFTECYLDNRIKMTIRPTHKIKVFVLDIDAGSKYRYNYQDIIDCLEAIGFCKCVRVISSVSGGLHLWFPLSVAINSKFLGMSIRMWLTENDFEVKDGVLEVFPTKGTEWKQNEAGKWEIEHLARCFRLPCQEGSYVVDEDENIIHNSIDKFWLEDFDWYAERQNLETFDEHNKSIALKAAKVEWQDDVLVATATSNCSYIEVDQVIKKKVGRPKASTTVQQELAILHSEFTSLGIPHNKFIKYLKDKIKVGWEANSMSNELIGAIAIVASYENRTADEITLAKHIKWEAQRLKGYSEFASEATKKDLNNNRANSWARRWAKSVIKYRSKRFKEV